MTQLIRNGELKKYHLNRNDILLSTNSGFQIELIENKTNETALDIYPNSLFNKKVSLLDENFVGFMMEVTDTKIIVFGEYEQRYDIPKIKTAEVNNNIVLDMEWNEFASYRVNGD
jgi:hypothetical protein